MDDLRERTCGSKRRYNSYSAKNRGVRSYKCPFCRNWHVTYNDTLKGSVHEELVNIEREKNCNLIYFTRYLEKAQTVYSRYYNAGAYVKLVEKSIGRYEVLIK